jgi:hypothetical protein
MPKNISNSVVLECLFDDEIHAIIVMKAQTRKEEGTSRVFRYGSYVIRK